MCVCVCVCVSERERDGERENTIFVFRNVFHKNYLYQNRKYHILFTCIKFFLSVARLYISGKRNKSGVNINCSNMIFYVIIMI